MDKQCNDLKTAIVLDDDADTRFAIGRILGKCGCQVIEAKSVEEVIALAQTQSIDVIFSDMRIPGEAGGEELLEIAEALKMDAHIVLMSCAMDAAMRTRLMVKGASECVQKPFFKDTCEQILLNLETPLKKSA